MKNRIARYLPEADPSTEFCVGPTLDDVKNLIEVKRILEKARRDRKGDWRTFEFHKRAIRALNLDGDAYSAAVRQLAEALGL